MQYVYKTLVASGLLFSVSTAYADDIHDPTAPKFAVQMQNVPVADSKASQEAMINLQGIVNRKGGHMAIIGGELYQVNDEVNGYKISQIEQTSVVLTKAGAQRRLYVYEQE